MLGRSRNIMKGKIILKKVGIVILCIVLLAAAVLIFVTFFLKPFNLWNKDIV